MAGKYSCCTIRSDGQDEAYRDLLGIQLYSLPVLQQVAKPWTSSSHSQQGAKNVTMFSEMLLLSSYSSFHFSTLLSEH